MKDLIRRLIQHSLQQLESEGQLPGGTPAEVHVENTKDRQHGDFASNIALTLAKAAGRKPRDLAQLILEHLPADPAITQVTIAGPGFLNFFQASDALEGRAAALLQDPNLGIAQQSPQRVVVDMSSPNLAKEMHVGHLRSTIIGDAVARVLEQQGHNVIRQNHVGDWGTQFGMLLAYLESQPDMATRELSDLENFYRAAKQRFDDSPEFAERARHLVVALQSGDPECLRLWREFTQISLSHCQALYDRLGVQLRPEDVHGESAYNADLPGIVEALRAQNLLVEDQGALCVFPAGFVNAEGQPLPFIVQKADGGYLYATTDLAAARYRSRDLNADRVLYFVDQRQALHFQMLFAVARMAEFVRPQTQLEHLGFGTLNGPDGRPFKTRDGGTVKLSDLLDEAEARALRLVQEKNPGLDVQQAQNIARAVGLGAVKYADLSKHRSSDYNFNFEQMLSLEGNTAPYLLYAYTRIASLFRRAELNAHSFSAPLQLQSPGETALAQKLTAFPEVLAQVATKGQPHLLCTYLYELAGLFSSFYEQHPVLNAPEPAVRDSRLALSALTGRILAKGLELLGLQPLERM